MKKGPKGHDWGLTIGSFIAFFGGGNPGKAITHALWVLEASARAQILSLAIVSRKNWARGSYQAQIKETMRALYREYFGDM